MLRCLQACDPSCLCLLRVGISDVHHHAQTKFFLYLYLLNIVQTFVTEETFTQFNVFFCVFKEKLSPQDQMNRHLTRPPPDYKDQRRNSSSLQPAAQYSGESSSKRIQIIAVKSTELLKTYSISPAFSPTLENTSAPPFRCLPLNRQTQTTRRTQPHDSHYNPSTQRRRSVGTSSPACAT